MADQEAPLNARGIHFDDWTEAAGVEYQWDFPPGQPNYRRNIGAGAAAEDLDGDGHVDLFVAGSTGNSKLFWNRGDETFDEGAAAAGGVQEEAWVTGVNSVDYDNNGGQDLFLNSRGPLRILGNEGGRRFSDVTQRAGLEMPNGGAGMALGDFDGDRHVDIFSWCRSGRAPLRPTTTRCQCAVNAMRSSAGRMTVASKSRPGPDSKMPVAPRLPWSKISTATAARTCTWSTSRPLRVKLAARSPAGFDVHAGVAIPRHARAALEKLLAYLARPPIPSSRL